MKLKNVLLYGKQLASVKINSGVITGIEEQSHLQGGHAKTVTDFCKWGMEGADETDQIFDGEGLAIAPAAVDCHVHSRDPGAPQKECWESLGRSAFKGGVVAVVDMPNTTPPTFFPEDVLNKEAAAARSGLDYRFLLGTGAVNLSSLRETLRTEGLPLAGLKIYYGQSTGDLMFSDLEALEQALPADYRGLLVFHSEDQCRIDQRYHDARKDPASSEEGFQSHRIHSHIRDDQSAWVSTRRILSWAETCPFRVHLAHTSTPEEVEWLEQSRGRGAELSSEVTPHHLLLSTEDYDDLGPFIKVNPPVRSSKTVGRLRTMFSQGLLDCFATDHAPHTKEEKRRAYDECPSGIPSIEFFWPLFGLVAAECGKTVWDLLPMICSQPAGLFGFHDLGSLAAGKSASFVLIEESSWVIS